MDALAAFYWRYESDINGFALCAMAIIAGTGITLAMLELLMWLGDVLSR